MKAGAVMMRVRIACMSLNISALAAVGGVRNAVEAQGARRRSAALVERGDEAVLSGHLGHLAVIGHGRCPSRIGAFIARDLRSRVSPSMEDDREPAAGKQRKHLGRALWHSILYIDPNASNACPLSDEDARRPPGPDAGSPDVSQPVSPRPRSAPRSLTDKRRKRLRLAGAEAAARFLLPWRSGMRAVRVGLLPSTGERD